VKPAGVAALGRLGLCAALLVLAGCATSQGTARHGNPADPYEAWNRKVFAFNEDLDQAVMFPVATAFKKTVPEPVRGGVSNFFANFRDAWSGINNFLQGKGEAGLQDLARVGTNTLFGLGGVLDVAGEMGLDHQYEDFGQTLGRWGVGPGPYLVLPVLGPSTVRDTGALPFDYFLASPSLLIDDTGARFGLASLDLVSTRASLLGATNLISQIALDKYTFMRDAYLQRRRSLIYDGNPPPEPEDDLPTAPSGASSAPAGNATPLAPGKP
jgi:phospholipid-binding lipoprotein MlaA